MNGSPRRQARLLTFVAVTATLAAACGSRVSPDQAAAEARIDAERAGLFEGVSAGTGAVPGAGDRSTDAATDTSGSGVSTFADGGTSGVSTGGGTATGSGGASAQGAGGSAGGPAAQDCREGADEVGVTDSQIRVGNVSTLSGPVPGLFRGALVGAQAYAAFVNSQGGLFCRELVVLSGDDGLDSGRNRAAHLDLKDKVFAFVGSFSTNDDGGASVLEECGCPDVGGSLARVRFNLPNHFNPQPQPPGWRSGPPTWYAQEYGTEVIEHWALFVSSIQSAREIAADMRKVYEAKGFTVVYTREVQPNETNFTGDVVQMRSNDVKALSWQGPASDMARLAATMRQQDFSVDLPNWGNDSYNPNFVEIAGEAAEGIVVDQVYSLFQGEDAGRVPEIATFNEWMRRIDPDQTVDLFSLYGWLSAKLFVEAMRQTDALTRESLLDTLGGMGEWNADGMVGPVNVGEKRPSDCFFVFTYRNGEYRRIFPDPGSDRLYACDVGPFVLES